MDPEKLAFSIGIGTLALFAWALSFLNIGPMVGTPTLPLDFTAVSLFTAAWTISMVAMMFPTTVPMLLMFFRVGRNSSRETREGGGPTPTKAFLFVATYIGIWATVGVMFYSAIAFIFGQLPLQANLFIGTTIGLGIALILVAAYQLSPIKGECLSRCHPSSFLYRYYKGGLSGSVRMGGDYAKYCVGCCWVMIAFLVVSGSMGLAWMAVFAGIIFVERTFPLRQWMPRIFGLGFLVVGATLVLVG